MTCFTPNQGYERAAVTKNGKHGFTYNVESARCVNGHPVRRTVPCRRCEGCRNASAREAAIKIMHEAQINFDGIQFSNSFLTLTYNDEFIPPYGALDYFDHWTNFLKRLRQAVAPIKIKFYMIGEYGDLNLRPHYHAIIFGYDFPDKYFHMDRLGNIIYRSPLLESLWTVPRGREFAGASYGYSSVGEVTYASAAYVARYSMKKDIGAQFDGIEEFYHEDTGEILTRPRPSKRYVRYSKEGDRIVVPAERSLQSNGGGSSGRGGLGKEWFDRHGMHDFYSRNVIPGYLSDDSLSSTYKDHTHMSNGLIVRPPKYYDKLLERVNPQILDSIKLSRQDHMAAHADEFTPERLASMREVFLGKQKFLKRESGRIYVGS